LDGTFATGFALAVIDVRSDELGLVLEHQIVAQPELGGHRPGIARGLRIRLAPDPLSSLRNTFTATGPKPPGLSEPLLQVFWARGALVDLVHVPSVLL